MNFHQGNYNSSISERDRYTRVDPAVVALLRCLHFETHWPAACRKTMLEMLFKEELRFNYGGTEVFANEVQPLFRELISGYFVPFLQDCYDELMILGVVIVRIVPGPTGDLVPVVVASDALGKFYDLRVYRNVNSGKPIYRVFRLVNKKGYQLPEPKEDKSAFVFNTLLKGPSVDGVVQSPVASLAAIQRAHDIMVQCNTVADFNLSDPTVVTETDASSALVDAPQDMYAPGDAAADLDGPYAQDHANQKHTLRHINSAMDSSNIWFPTGEGFELKKQIQNNVVPLPIGHRVVTGMPQPVRRPDMERMNNQYEYAVSVVYGVPRGFMVQDVSFKTAGASDILEAGLRHSLMLWASRLSLVMTAVMRCAYFPNDCNHLFGVFARLFGKDPQSLDRLLTIAGTITDIRATLPVSPAVDLEELTMLYDRGVVSWEEYVVQSRTMKGLITTTIPPEPPKDPENAAAAAPPKKRQRT
jgi:hypothetical protein